MIFDQSILPFPKCILPSFPSLSTVSLYNFPFHFLSVVQASLSLIQLSLPLSLIFPSLKFLPSFPFLPSHNLTLIFPSLPTHSLPTAFPSLPTTFLFLFLSLPLVQFFSSLPKNLPFPKIHLLPYPSPSPSYCLFFPPLPLPLCPFTSPSLPFPFIMFLFPFVSSPSFTSVSFHFPITPLPLHIVSLSPFFPPLFPFPLAFLSLIPFPVNNHPCTQLIFVFPPFLLFSLFYFIYLFSFFGGGGKTPKIFLKGKFFPTI